MKKIPTDEVGILYVDRDVMNRISTEVKRLFAVVQFCYPSGSHFQEHTIKETEYSEQLWMQNPRNCCV